MNEKSLFVVGAGFMGMGIVQTAATHGIKVSVYDVSQKALKMGMLNIEKFLSKGVKKGKYTEEQKQEWLSNISIAKDISECADADVIIEAIIENREAKHEVFKQIANYARKDAILASNTSSISVTNIASEVEDPEHFVGMHFFSPVPKMALMEVVQGLQTSEETILKAVAFGEKMGKKCIVSKDEAGFIINRMLIPMLNEACILLERHTGNIEQIDSGVKLGLNHPMGPLELVDMIGIDVALAIMEVLHDETGDSKYRPAITLRKMVDAGFLGKKAGIGFYIYNEDGTKVPNPKMDPIDVEKV